MDPPPPLPPHPSSVTSVPLNYPESADSSPRKAETSWDEPLPPVPGARLRLMCSYGGHIIPRPHDKTLCYVGGETRMVVADRHSSLADLSSRISRTLLNGRGFTLKYQLPNEDLDNLISVTTNEDLENMIEEYDRTMSTSPLKPSRLRLFLFPAKPETSTSMGSLLDDAKSETWFVDALNGSGLLPRGLSDSAAIDDCLLDGDASGDSCQHLEAQTDSSCNIKHVTSGQELHSVPDSPLVETASSFGSTSSSPSMSNLPPIRVRVEDTGLRLHDHKVGLEEEFAHLSTNPQTVVRKQDEGFVVLSAPPPLPSNAIVSATMSAAGAVSGETPSRIISDDERSDHGVRVGFRKPPLPLQPVQRKLDDGFNLPSPDSKHGGGFNFPSPDSVASDSSIASATSFSRAIAYQDPVHITTKDNRPPTPIDPKKDTPESGSRIQIQQIQESGYAVPPQVDQPQQQVVHASMHYIHHPPATPAMPISSYYPIYAPPPQHQQPLHPQIDQQYPVYLLPITQSQPYSLPVQSNVADSSAVASSRALTTPAPAMLTTPPIYPTKPEMAASVYRTVGAATAPLAQVPPSQFQQQQYVGFPQLHHPPQSIVAGNPNYAFEYAHPAQDQAYYSHPPAAPLPSQYQTMTSTAAVALSEASTQMPMDMNTVQQIRTSQPL